MKHHITLIKNNSKHWPLFLIAGVVFTLTGIYCLFYPFAKPIGVAHIFGILALLTGIAKIVFSVKNKNDVPGWIWHLGIGVSDLLMGIVLLTYTGFSMIILPFLLSFWILAGTVTLIEEVSDIKNFHTPENEWIVAGGIFTLLSSFIVAFLPIIGVITTIFWSAASFIATGLFYIILSLRLKSIEDTFHL